MDDTNLQQHWIAGSTSDPVLAKKIKKNIYGKLQAAKIIYPSGFSSIALKEINAVLATLWHPQKTPCEVVFQDNEIYLYKVHVFTLVELMLRCQCITDVRLVISQGKVIDKYTFEKKCKAVVWPYYLNQAMKVKIRVNSIASKAFHESALKNILSQYVKEYVHDVVNGDDISASTHIYAELYKNKLMLSISLAGKPLYKRGFRSVLSASAPLREDMAAASLSRALQWGAAINPRYSPETVLIPFSGTGTFAFEFLQRYYNFSPGLYNRWYALQAMPLYRQEHFHFILQRAKLHATFLNEKSNVVVPKIICIDLSATANAALLKNYNAFQQLLAMNHFHYDQLNDLTEDVLTMNVATLNLLQCDSDIFIPLNPPYGVRLNKNADSNELYKKIAYKINQLKQAQNEKKNILGFILCPTEATWIAFLQHLKNAKTETYHFNQGGVDVRICQFYI